jgi:hypothetical protein
MTNDSHRIFRLRTRGQREKEVKKTAAKQEMRGVRRIPRHVGIVDNLGYGGLATSLDPSLRQTSLVWTCHPSLAQ